MCGSVSARRASKGTDTSTAAVSNVYAELVSSINPLFKHMKNQMLLVIMHSLHSKIDGYLYQSAKVSIVTIPHHVYMSCSLLACQLVMIVSFNIGGK